MSKKHGMSRTRLYQIWASMKHRCDSPNAVCYHRYGGRGITYCDEWSNFEPFMEWAYKSGYSDDLTIDRINNDKGYYPENCKWSTQKEQALNKQHVIGVSGYRGVRPHYRSWKMGHKLDGYVCSVCINGKDKYIGHAKTAKEACRMRERFLKTHER